MTQPSIKDLIKYLKDNHPKGCMSMDCEECPLYISSSDLGDYIEGSIESSMCNLLTAMIATNWKDSS